MEFEKSAGKALGGPKAWAARNMPMCPLCKRSSEWETASEQSMGVKRQYIRCPNCTAVFSSVATTIVGPAPINVAMKSVDSSLVRVESTGENKELGHLAGKEFALSELNEWARKSR